jgi:hypothetical protein
MSSFSPVTNADLARARPDQAFRQKVLAQILDALLSGNEEAPRGSSAVRQQSWAKQPREGVELAVRLAEPIQNASGPARDL